MKKNIIKKNGKRLLIAVISIAVMLMTSVTAYAWFTYRRQLDTITRINSPTTLVIGAGAKESSLNINMGGIDVADEACKKDFVFSVYSDESVENYKIQLAHTTNIDFNYSIYKAAEHTDDPGNDRAVYTDESGNTFYYTKNGDALSGVFLNLDQDGKTADKSLHDKSYDNYDKKYVQKNAEPLYWQTADVIQPTNNSGSGFLDYYILEVSWNENAANNKETDIVYITAGMV